MTIKHALLALLFAMSPGWCLAQLYGVTPYQNGPLPHNGGLYVFDPDTLTFLDGREVTVAGPSILSLQSIAVHPVDPPGTPPPERLEGVVYALARQSTITDSVLIRLSPDIGVAVVIGQLGDKFATISFDSTGQLYGITTDDASIPEHLYRISKLDASKVSLQALGNGNEGEVLTYHPGLNRLFHWSGDPTVVYETIPVTAPYFTTAVPVFDPTDGQTFGAAWDPCQPRTVNGKQTLAFIVSNDNQRFNFWTTGGRVSPSLGNTPDAIRGMALIGGLSCDVDLAVGAGSPNPNVAPSNPMTILLVVANAGQARAMNPVLTITPPQSLSGITTSGCLEDPAGIPTCTLKIPTQRWADNTGYVPFNLSSLWRNHSVTVTLTGTYDGNAGDVVASVTSGSNETEPLDNSTRLRLGDLLMRDSFE